MEYRSYSLTGAKQNLGIHYSQNRMPHLLNFNGQFQEAKKNPIAKPSNILHSITNLGQPEMPFAFESYQMPFAYDSEKKFVNHKKEFSTYRENNFIKEPIVNKTMNDSQYFGPKGNGGMCSTMGSHIVGGFVGSKSQVNIGTKKTKACDLGTFIFDVLNNLKWGRSEERITRNKNTENCVNTSVQQNSSPQFKCTEKSSQKMDVDRNVNFGNIINLSNKNMNQNCDRVNGMNAACLRVNIPTTSIEEISQKRNHNVVIKDCVDEFGKEKNEEVFQPLCSTPVPKVENPASDSSNSSKVEPSKSVSFQICGSPVEKVAAIKSEEPQSPECSWKNKICTILGSRFRQQSECSVDSTDSESFIVFDDRCCESIDDEDEEGEEMDDEEDTLVMDDDYVSI